MGDVGTEFVYMPKSDGSHYVDGFLNYDTFAKPSVENSLL